MFSDVLQEALQREVVGQSAAVHSVVRGATRVISGLTPRERKWCAYMFMGPSGTGKTQLVQTLAKTLHGEGRGLFIADCTHYVHGDPWMAFASQVLPMFSVSRAQENPRLLEAPPLSILLVEYLERGRKEISKALAATLETGSVTLPDGRLGSLRNCLLFITTSLCSETLLAESPRIGFKGIAGRGEEQDRTSRACRAQAEEHFGEDLIGHLDSLVLFHPLGEDHMAEILDRRFDRLTRWLEPRAFRCEMRDGARQFLLEHGRGDPKLGARHLVGTHRRFVEFPLADLMISGPVPPGAVVVIDHEPENEFLHFTVTRGEDCPEESPRFAASTREVPIEWGCVETDTREGVKATERSRHRPS